MSPTEDVLRILVILKAWGERLDAQQKAGTISAEQLAVESALLARQEKTAWTRARSMLGLPGLL